MCLSYTFFLSSIYFRTAIIQFVDHFSDSPSILVVKVNFTFTSIINLAASNENHFIFVIRNNPKDRSKGRDRRRTVHDHENIERIIKKELKTRVVDEKDMVNEIWARLENQLKPKGWVLYSLWFTVKNYETRLDVEIWKVVVLPI